MGPNSEAANREREREREIGRGREMTNEVWSVL